MWEVQEMRTVSFFKNGNNQAVCLPADMAYEGIGELEIRGMKASPKHYGAIHGAEPSSH